MKPNQWALILGGLLPALLFGISGSLQKASTRSGIGTGPYLIGTGLVVLAIGVLFTVVERDSTVNRAG